MTKTGIVFVLALILGCVGTALASDSVKAPSVPATEKHQATVAPSSDRETEPALTEDQLYRIRYAVMLLNEGDNDHAAWVIEPLIAVVPDPQARAIIEDAYNCLYIGTYEMAVRARYLLMSLL